MRRMKSFCLGIFGCPTASADDEFKRKFLADCGDMTPFVMFIKVKKINDKKKIITRKFNNNVF